MFLFDYKSGVELKWELKSGFVENGKTHENFGDENLNGEKKIGD